MDREVDTKDTTTERLGVGGRFDGDALSSSKYYERFQKAKQFLNLVGDNVLVERLPKPDMVQRTKSGILLPTTQISTHRTAHTDDIMEFGLVLAIGPGQHVIGEDGQLKILPPLTKPGDIILLTDNIEWYSQFGHMADYDPNTIGRIRDSNVMMFFSEYMKFIEALNGTKETDTL